MAEKQNLDVPMIATAGTVSVVLTVAAVFGVQALYYSYSQSETNRKVVAIPDSDANSKLAEQDAKLTRYAWADRASGKVVIPIERAMSLTVDDYRKALVSPTSAVDPGKAAP